MALISDYLVDFRSGLHIITAEVEPGRPFAVKARLGPSVDAEHVLDAVRAMEWTPSGLAYFDGDAVADAGPAPAFAAWDWDALAWVVDFDRARAETRERIKLARAEAMTAPLITPYGVFDADGPGQQGIKDAVLMEQTLVSMGYPAEIDFTLHDNSVVSLSAPAMVQVGLILGARVQALHASYRVLRAAIEAATTTDELEAIQWT